MPEARNNFLKSRMNKDLEQRLVPPGEYRDAKNVMISRSEGDDVGALENVLGNTLINNFKVQPPFDLCCGEEVIGYFMDMINNRIFAFTTNFSDTSTNQLDQFAPTSALCGMYVYDIKTSISTIIVKGYFLNFSKTHFISGVNVIEQYLFWTDNRNQPRKININQALGNPSYYENEDQISVSKYYPFESPLLIKNEVIGLNMVGPFPYGQDYSTGFYNLQPVTPTADTGEGLQVEIDFGCLNISGEITCATLPIRQLGSNYTNGGIYWIVNPSQPQSNWAQCQLITDWVSTMYNRTDKFLPDNIAPNPNYDPDWDGDQNFIKDKFIRFAYRFKFDDGEYSLISPFTQECFVPEQDGYFIKNWSNNGEPAGDGPYTFTEDDEEATYVSTEVKFMQNKINEIDVIFNSPLDNWKQSCAEMNIVEMDIIYKQSNEQSLRIVETIIFDDETGLDSPVFQYKYKSEAPYRTLPQKDLLRVYDKVPVRAKTQEWAENRIIYGNFFDKPTPPDSIDYVVNSTIKEGDYDEDVKKEYQNHTLKQNRSYQAGIVLSDRYGRQSSVILAEDDNSTYFHPYKDGNNAFMGFDWCCEDIFDPSCLSGSNTSFSWYDENATEGNLLGPHGINTPLDTWPGDALNMIFVNPISSSNNPTTGTPGLYMGYGVIDPDQIEWISTGAGCGSASYSVDYFAGQGSGTGMSLTTTAVAGEITAITFDSLGEGYMQGDVFTISDCAGEPASFRLLNLQKPNPLGWYSWKAVVKQVQSDYYNVYTPGILNGYIDGEGPNAGYGEDELIGATPQRPVGHFALYGDNINKIPRDLSLVGPTQNSFRSGRPTVADDPSYYNFINTDGDPFTINPYTVDAETLLKQRDRELELDSGSQINNALINLSPRVLNSSYAFNSNGGNPLTVTKQWYPGQSFSTVVTIGTGVELGLWDPSANPPYNTAPSFYNYEINPLIAKLDIGSSIDAKNCFHVDDELDYFGKKGPSPEAGIVRYHIGEYDVVSGMVGDEYVPGSLNVGGEPVVPSSSHPAPYTKTGEQGSGLLFNITGINDGGSFSANKDIAGPLIDRGISIANTEGQNGVKGMISPSNSYPYEVRWKIIGSGDGNGVVRVQVTKEEWPGDMEPRLAVLETQAIESKLDIYWESSTSGLLSELNKRIIEEDEFTPTNIHGYNGAGTYLPLVYTQNEADNIGVNCFNGLPLCAIAQGGLVNSLTVGGPVTMSIKNVWCNGVDVASRFSLTPSGSLGYYNLVTNDYFVYCDPLLSNTFEFIITVKSPTVTYSIDGTFTYTDINLGSYTLLNSAPYFPGGCPMSFSFSKAAIPGWYNFPIIMIDFLNGTNTGNDIVSQKCGLLWSKISVENSSGVDIVSGPNTWTYIEDTNWLDVALADLNIYFQENIPLDTYTISFYCVDSGNLSSPVCTFDVTVNA